MLMLNLASGRKKRAGMVNVDYDDSVDADDYVDLNQLPWPWDTSSVDFISCHNAAHQLVPLGRSHGQLNIAGLMQEIWRVLKPGSQVELIVPSTQGLGAFADPLAATFWNENTFLNFLEGQVTDMGYPKFEVETRGSGVEVSSPDGLGQVWVIARLHKPGTVANGDGDTSESELGSAEGAGTEPVPSAIEESGEPEI